MICLQTLSLKDAHVFKDVNVDLTDNNGLVVVTGHNKDATVDGGSNTNAVGKSLLFSFIPNVAYRSPPLARKKKSKKDLLGKNTKNTLTFSSNGTSLTVEQSAKGYTLLKNNVDTEIKTIPNAEKEIDKHWPITEEEFYSCYYIQSQKHLAFQTGTPSERLDFITKVFNLDIFDKLKKHFKKKLDHVHDEEIKYNVLETRLNTVQQRLNVIDWTKEQYDKSKLLRKKQKKVKLRVEALYKDLNTKQQLLRSFQQLIKIEKDLKVLRARYPFKQLPDKMKKILLSQKKQAEQYKDYKRDLRQYKSTVEALTTKLDKCGPYDPNIQSEYDKTKDKRDKVKARLLEYQQVAEQYKELKAQYDKALADRKTLPVPTHHDQQEIEEELALTNRLLKNKHLVDHDECPTCLQTIDTKKMKGLLRAATKSKQELTQALEYIKLSSTIKTLESKLDNIEYDEKKHYALLSIKEQIDQELASLEQALLLSRKREELQALLNSTTKPKKVLPSEYDLNEIEQHIELCDSVLNLLSAKNTVLDMYPALKDQADGRTIHDNHSALKEQYSTLQAESEHYTSLYTKITNKVQTYTLRHAEYQTLEADRLELEQQLERIRPILRKRKLFKTLMLAYSSKGLKLRAANNVLKMLEENMNRYSSLIFAEPCKFVLKTDKNGIHVLIQRHNQQTCDVRMLSGAETNCFRPLFAISILPLIPENRRLNLMILDEPDCHMSDVVRHRLINEFIPRLRTVVPHVFFITPKSTDDFHDAVEWTITKDHGVSTITIKKPTHNRKVST